MAGVFVIGVLIVERKSIILLEGKITMDKDLEFLLGKDLQQTFNEVRAELKFHNFKMFKFVSDNGDYYFTIVNVKDQDEKKTFHLFQLLLFQEPEDIVEYILKHFKTF